MDPIYAHAYPNNNDLPFVMNQIKFEPNHNYDYCSLPHSNVAPEEEPLTWMFWRKRRYIVVLMAFLGFFNVYALRVNLSVGIVAMTEKRPVDYGNGTIGYVSVLKQDIFNLIIYISGLQEQHFPWDSREQGLILSSFFYGYILTQFAGGYFGSRIGGNWVRFNLKQLVILLFS